MDYKNITTVLELPGKKIVKNFGLVRGITVRSRSIFGTIGGCASYYYWRKYYCVYQSLRKHSQGIF